MQSRSWGPQDVETQGRFLYLTATKHISPYQIYLDGVDIRQLDLPWLRRQLGVVSQEPGLFAGSVTENIAIGKEDADDTDVQEAAKAADAHNFILNLPQVHSTETLTYCPAYFTASLAAAAHYTNRDSNPGVGITPMHGNRFYFVVFVVFCKAYETFLTEGGGKMSGGQKQRLAIARALIRHPRILLLDEATSALDTKSEKVVQAAFEKAYQGRTVVMIAHRLSTVRNADRIAVMDRGVVQEIGTHDELLRRGGIFANMLAKQARHLTS